MKRLLGLVMILAACGGGDDRVDDFIGTWTYQAGASSNADCDNDQLDMMDQLTGSLQFAAGSMSDLIEVPGGEGACPPVRFDVDGGTATAQAGQSCTETIGTAPNTVMVTLTYSTYTLTLDSAGTSATVSGRATASFTGAVTAMCTVTAAGSIAKASARTAGEPGVMSRLMQLDLLGLRHR